MPFPNTPRILYAQNPLDKVICQLRFPPILKIDVETPADFQESIREQFPLYSEKTEVRHEITANFGGSGAQEAITPFAQTTRNKNHQFETEDNTWWVNLSRTFLALTTSDYHRREQFREMLGLPLEALKEWYSPSYFTRVGLRYTDTIKRSALGLEEASWSDLLQPHLLGPLGVTDVSSRISEFTSKFEIQLADQQSYVRIVLVLAREVGGEEEVFVIDSDFYRLDKTPIEEAGNLLEYFQERASRLIQWCITPILHKAMQPEEI